MHHATKVLRTFAVSLVLLIVTACRLTAPPGISDKWTNYPGLPGTTSTTERWLVVKCKVADIPRVEVSLDRRINGFFGLSGAGFGNLVDYFFDVSYHQQHFRGEPLAKWVTAPFTSDELAGTPRKSRVEQCVNAVAEADLPDLDGFTGVAVVSNVVKDAGACYTGKQTLTIHESDHKLGCVFLDGNSLFINFAAHEIGHGIGMEHSFDDGIDLCGGSEVPGEYCDPWDVMSAMDTFTFPDYNWRINGRASRAGPGLGAPALLARGWIPLANQRTFDDGVMEQTFTLRALSHPRGDEPLVIFLVLRNSEKDATFYTVEYRQADGWDRAFASGGVPEGVLKQGGAVLVHKYGGAGTPISTLLKQPIEKVNRGALLPSQGLTITGTSNSYYITVRSFDLEDGSATVAIGRHD